MAQSVERLSHKPEKPSSNPSKLIKEPGLGLCTWNPSPEPVERGGLLGPAGRSTLPVGVELQILVTNSISKASR